MTPAHVATPLKRHVPILMYHQVSNQAICGFEKYIHTTRQFAMQVAWLALAGYTPITFETLLGHWHGAGELPRRPVIITFDDGYRDCVVHATRILRARRFTAYFYLVAGLMGQCSAWLRDEQARALRLIDWDEAKALEMQGFHCGAHSMTHPHLAELDWADCCTEICRSRALIEQHLGHPVVHFAYPYGSFNAMVREAAAEAGFATACSTRIGLADPDSADMLGLRRVPMNGFDSLAAFIAKLRWGKSVPEIMSARSRRHAQQQVAR
jgi:peptidoglycan/xylan/chitin deacetylase (PgdA/CDA1 family)